MWPGRAWVWVVAHMGQGVLHEPVQQHAVGIGESFALFARQDAYAGHAVCIMVAQLG